MISSPVEHWEPYAPNAEQPWNLARVVRLHRRSGFGVTAAVAERDVADGHDAAIARVLNGTGPPRAETIDLMQRLVDGAVTTANLPRLQAVWIYRMLFGTHPLAERMTLFWHNWFATSAAKVQKLMAMQVQNETMRRLGRGPFRLLLDAMMRDTALLEWLDARENTKDRPNENLARELFELFTIGVGNYTEADVRETARALTGWGAKGSPPAEDPTVHDDGPKTVLGKSGRFRMPDVLEIALAHPALAPRLADRLIAHFMGEAVVSDAARASLASYLASHDLDVGRAIEVILRSNAFFSDANAHACVVGPVEFLVGSVKPLGLGPASVSTLEIARRLPRVGQDLFLPPNVAGWPLGRASLSTQSMAARINFASDLVDGRILKTDAPLDLGASFPGVAMKSPKDVTVALTRALRGEDPSGEEAAWLAASGAVAGDGAAAMRRAASLVFSSPWSQVS